MTGRMFRVVSWAAGALMVGSLALAPAVASAQAAAAPLVVEGVDFGFKTSAQTAAPGVVSFAFRNTGARPHELIVVKSDAAPLALPLKDGRVDEASVNIVGRLARVTPPAATTGLLNVDLAQGRYLVICNIGTHYASGMTFSLVVGNAGTPAAPVPPSATTVPASGAAAPTPARTGNGGPMSTEAGTTGALALGMLALAFVTGARAWTGRDAR